ncbi:MAG: LysR substrate-binding domain-containing protein [Polaromonas sp.]
MSGNLAFNHVAPAAEACAAGVGLGMFLSYQVAPFLQSRQLRTVLEDFEPPTRPINVVYPHARLLPMRTRVFIEWIKKELQGFQT